MTFTLLIKATLTSRRVIALLFLVISSAVFTPQRESTREKSTNPRERSNSRNDSGNCVQQCWARDIIAYCVQFANGPRAHRTTPDSLLHIHLGNVYAIINPVRYYDRWWIASTMLQRYDSSLSMRSTWSIEINDRPPIEFFRLLFNDLLVDDSSIHNVREEHTIMLRSVKYINIAFDTLIIDMSYRIK